ncbi:SET and MYND domain-containing protein 4 [Vermiconidia calcicola]|uniref:SET and MYND domain-containing protein 4 n=1 Tax=Vermiconidia calcicola TaxID=1690605 RepID=A0ACC3N6A5_9PEZI|nr:SET and MYND domain-containing protein 4 [Vermiconidia calcicola]
MAPKQQSEGTISRQIGRGVTDSSSDMADKAVQYLHDIASNPKSEEAFDFSALMEWAGKRMRDQQAPALTGRHGPSTASLADLQPVSFKTLLTDARGEEKVIYLKIRSVSIGNGMTLAVQDSEEKEGSVWSLIEYPLPGGPASMAPGTFIAVREPYYGTSPNGQLAICVHHPTDIEHIFKFDSKAMEQFPSLRAIEQITSPLRAEDAAFVSSSLMEALDCYSEGIAKVYKQPTSKHIELAGEFCALLSKRAFTYARTGLHNEAFADATEALIHEPKHQQALKIGCSSALEIGKYDGNQRLSEKVALRMQHIKGQCDLNTLAGKTTRSNMVHDVSHSIGDIEIRESKLGGRGVFAKQRFVRGQIVLWEKPIAMSFDEKVSSFEHGLRNFMGHDNGDYCNRSSMAFVQQLAAKTAADPSLAEKLFDMFDGSQPEPNVHGGSEKQIFDSYRAINIVKYNYHNVNWGNASINQQFYDPNTKFEIPKEFQGSRGSSLDHSLARGLWYMNSMLNHSCLPDTSFTNIGNLLIVKIQGDIEKDEELTTEYVERGLPYEERKKGLTKYAFECCCPLCEIEVSLPPEAKAKRQQMYQPPEVELPTAVQNRSVRTVGLESKIQDTLKTYGAELKAELPCVLMMQPLFNLAHTYLGPIADWGKASPGLRAKGHDYFLWTLMLGLRINLLHAPSTPYCKLAFSKHSLTHAIGVLALIGLAGLAYISPALLERKRAVALLRCAKILYKMHYTEDATFDERSQKYKCKSLSAGIDAVAPPEDWDKVKGAPQTKRGVGMNACNSNVSIHGMA